MQAVLNSICRIVAKAVPSAWRKYSSNFSAVPDIVTSHPKMSLRNEAAYGLETTGTWATTPMATTSVEALALRLSGRFNTEPTASAPTATQHNASGGHNAHGTDSTVKAGRQGGSTVPASS